MNDSTAQRNDFFRSNIPFSITPAYVLVVTQGIGATFSNKQIADILTIVREFDSFNEDNDPWHEHDFGSFNYCDHKLFWKIDNYNGQDNLQLVLTIMLAEEY